MAEANSLREAAEEAEAKLAAFRKEMCADGGGTSMSAAEEAKCRKDYVRAPRERLIGPRPRATSHLVPNCRRGLGLRCSLHARGDPRISCA